MASGEQGEEQPAVFLASKAGLAGIQGHGPGPVTAESLRWLFPGLSDGFARFDGPAGAQAPVTVLEAMDGYLRTTNTNLGGAARHSVATEAVVTESRERLAAFLGATPGEVGFGMNATMINFQLVLAAAHDLRAGDEIVVTDLDHDANIAPWQQAAADRDLVIRVVPATADTRLNMDALAQTIGDRTKVVAFPWANNLTGTMVNVPQVVKLTHAAGAIAWADPTHYLPHGPVDVRQAGVDVLIGSAYKFFGPHVGVFYVRQELAGRWPAYHGSPHSGPAAARFEAGTLPFEALAGLTAALRYLDTVGWDFIATAERQLGQRFLAGLPPRWHLHGIPAMEGRTATFALTLPGHDPGRIAKALAAQKIAVTAGDFHSPAILRPLGIDGGVVRAGILHYTTEAEIERLLRALADIAAAAAP